MGKIAQPNTPYCGGFTQGAISAGGQIFTTQNPPISYTLSGKTATISDATGVIGEADLTGELIEASRTKANPGVEYCGAPYAELKVGNKTFGTENPPISYALKTKALRVNGQLLNLSKEIQSWTTQQQSAGVRVDWGGGDVDILTGTTWNIDTSSSSIDDPTQYFVNTGSPSAPGLSGPGTIPNNGITYRLFRASNQLRFTFQAGDIWAVSRWHTPGVIFGLCTVTRNGTQVFSGEFGYVGVLISTTTKTVTTNTGATSQRTTTIDPIVFLQLGDCLLNITYTDGTTQSFTYTECPTVEPVQCAEVSDSNGVMGESCPFNGEATAVCYDYDITEVKYVCEGNCPSAEFECRCEASNTLMCYGWDPNNPDVFKPLFVTSITSESES